MNVILMKLSFWRSVYVEYWERKQHDDILQFLQVKAEKKKKKVTPEFASYGKLYIT